MSEFADTDIFACTIFRVIFYLGKDRSIWDMQQLDDLTSKLGIIRNSQFEWFLTIANTNTGEHFQPDLGQVLNG